MAGRVDSGVNGEAHQDEETEVGGDNLDTAGGVAWTRERDERGAARANACEPPEIEERPIGDLRRTAERAGVTERGRAERRAGSGGASVEERSVGLSKETEHCREEAEVGAERVDEAREEEEVGKATGAEAFEEDRRREGAIEGACRVETIDGARESPGVGEESQRKGGRSEEEASAEGRRRADIIGAGGGITTSAVHGRAEGEGLGPSRWIEAHVSRASEGMSKNRADSETGTESINREQPLAAELVGLAIWSRGASEAGVGDGDMEMTIREDSRVRDGRTIGEETTCTASVGGSRGVLGSSRVTVVMSWGYMRSLLWRKTRGRVSCFFLFRMALRDAMSAAFRAADGPPNTSVIRGWLRSVAMSLA